MKLTEIEKTLIINLLENKKQKENRQDVKDAITNTQKKIKEVD